MAEWSKAMVLSSLECSNTIIERCVRSNRTVSNMFLTFFLGLDQCLLFCMWGRGLSAVDRRGKCWCRACEAAGERTRMLEMTKRCSTWNAETASFPRLMLWAVSNVAECCSFTLMVRLTSNFLLLYLQFQASCVTSPEECRRSWL